MRQISDGRERARVYAAPVQGKGKRLMFDGLMSALDKSKPAFEAIFYTKLFRDEIDCVEFAGRFEPCPKPFKTWDEFRAFARREREQASATRCADFAARILYAEVERDYKRQQNRSDMIDAFRFAMSSMPVILDSPHYVITPDVV